MTSNEATPPAPAHALPGSRINHALGTGASAPARTASCRPRVMRTCSACSVMPNKSAASETVRQPCLRCHSLLPRILTVRVGLGVRRQGQPGEIGGKLSHVLAERLRITCGEANRRIGEAQDLGQRTALRVQP